MDEVLEQEDQFECVTCGHEWTPEPVARVIKDAYGNVLVKGDVVQMVKDLKLKGTLKTLKSGMKSKPISLADGDHEISCKMDGLAVMLKAQFVKKVS